MDPQVMSFGRKMVRRALALLACGALLFFVAGNYLHKHADGPDTACHVCQALHMPALAATRLDLGNSVELVLRFCSLPQHLAPSDSFSLHRAGRAPPTA
jgi:hypothetical protein